jgi:hypothetical protein
VKFIKIFVNFEFKNFWKFRENWKKSFWKISGNFVENPQKISGKFWQNSWKISEKSQEISGSNFCKILEFWHKTCASKIRARKTRVRNAREAGTSVFLLSGQGLICPDKQKV